MIGVVQDNVEEKLRSLLPGYMAMGKTGMAGGMDMGRPKNTLPMASGAGPFGSIDMGGMFTVFKVRERLTTTSKDPGWYAQPPGTSPRKL